MRTLLNYGCCILVLAGVLTILAGCTKKTAEVLPDNSIPAVTTNSVLTVLTTTSAQSGGTVTSQGATPVTARGVCYCIAPKMPTLDDSHTEDGSGTGVYASDLNLLTGDTVYFVRAYATNSKGTSYGNRVSFYSNPSSPFFPGQNYGGGIIFYIDGTHNHGFIAATTEYSAPWGCYGSSIPGTAKTMNTGHDNTNTILAACPEKLIAAGICYDLALNGKTDWFLPSRDELNQLYLKKDFVGGFGEDSYWCSSQYDANQAYSQNFADGTINTSSKNGVLWVRAIRAF